MERLNRCIAFDEKSGLLRAEGGLSLKEILDVFVPRGWFLPVTPGTKYATLGGCVACDVHGKNHHGEGTISKHITEIELLLADGTLRRCSPLQYPDLFWATVGGMGLTGIITEVAIQLKKIPSAYIRARHRVAPDLEAAMKLLSGEGSQDLYSVAWIDCLASGSRLGRSVVMTGHHAEQSALPAGVRDPYQFCERRPLSVPFTMPTWLLNPWTVKAFNACYGAIQGKKDAPFTVDYDRYFYPLDAVQNWNRIYGKRGFLQYQCVLPCETAAEGLRILLEKLTASRRPSFLAVLKRFGPGGSGMLSFPMEGYTLALDLSYHPSLFSLLESLDEEVVARGGRVYLAKDARLSSSHFQAMYPRLKEWLAVKQKIDPGGKFSSDLSQRLGIGPNLEAQ
jgi:FAD/FMN-containing dehydrogenase